jgi:lipopolysaccharide transport system permease protein
VGIETLSQASTPPGAGTGLAIRPRPVRIKPARGWVALNLKELWDYRDLLLILASRDIKLRYKQTALGVIWVLLQPLLSSLIFAVIFGRLANLPSDGLPYVLFVYAGMLPWNLFSGALQRAGNSLISDSRLISKVYFPRMIIPTASSLAVLADLAVALGVMVVLMIVYQISPTWHLFALPVFVLLSLLIAVGVGLWISAFNVYYRDFTYALPFVIQVWLYASPVVYSSKMVPVGWRGIYAVNPLVGVIAGFRWCLLGSSAFPVTSASLSLLVGLVIFVGGALVFRRIERNFADVV